MIKIVNNAMPRRARCRECCSELEFEYNDIQRERSDDHILHMTITTSFITCPICKERVILGQYGKDWD